MQYRETEPNIGRRPRIFIDQGPGTVEEARGQQSLQPLPVEGGQVGQQLGQVKLAREFGGHRAPGLAQAGPDEGGLGFVVLGLNQPLDPVLGRIVKFGEKKNSLMSDALHGLLNANPILFGTPCTY